MCVVSSKSVNVYESVRLVKCEYVCFPCTGVHLSVSGFGVFLCVRVSRLCAVCVFSVFLCYLGV